MEEWKDKERKDEEQQQEEEEAVRQHSRFCSAPDIFLLRSQPHGDSLWQFPSLCLSGIQSFINSPF